jgi:hypothetical protein
LFQVGAELLHELSVDLYNFQFIRMNEISTQDNGLLEKNDKKLSLFRLLRNLPTKKNFTNVENIKDFS